jgi:hypothetical protein
MKEIKVIKGTKITSFSLFFLLVCREIQMRRELQFFIVDGTENYPDDRNVAS